MEGANLQKQTVKKSSPNKSKKKVDVRAYAMLGGLVLIWILFSILTDGAFLSARNLTNLSMQMAVVAILGTGMVLVIVTGHIDLSVGSLVGLVGGIAASLMVWNDWGTVPTIIVVLAVGLIAGATQGFATVYLGVPAFIVTLGGMMVFRGILLGITDGVSISPMNDTYRIFGATYVPNIVTYSFVTIVITTLFFLEFKRQKSKRRLGLEINSGVSMLRLILLSLLMVGIASFLVSYRGMPVPMFIMLILVMIFTFIAEKTKFGRSVYAIGGNLQAAKYSGIKVKKVVLGVFALNGLMAAIAGIILSARLNTGAPSAGTMLELDAIAAAVIGGTSLMGGRGKIYGAILGALIMASLDNGMSLLNIQAFWQYIVKGGILILAVWFDVYTKKKGKV